MLGPTQSLGGRAGSGDSFQPNSLAEAALFDLAVGQVDKMERINSGAIRIHPLPANADGCEEISERPLGACRRAVERVELDLDALLTFPSGRSIKVRLKNLSSNGVMAEAPEWLEPGARVHLVLPAIGNVEAEVVWQMAGRFGACFIIPLSPAQLFTAGIAGRERGRA